MFTVTSVGCLCFDDSTVGVEQGKNMTDVVGKLGGSVLGRFVGVWADSRRREQEDQRALRRGGADDLLAWIPELRELLVRLETTREVEPWKAVMSRAFTSMRRAEQLAPHEWRHLSGSLFDAIGNGAGSVVWIDLTPSLAEEAPTYDHRWTMNAVEYIEYLQAKVQQWKHAYSAKRAAKVKLLSYNDWLHFTGRLAPFE
ncbi:hypothetical protein [Microterricola pindariensis]|uniref:Uncharacterized protein n=1 Tax=Microterricola pindariensis TaxID=478010 RepID=A0ABX5AWA4_9MICO|nr:hypothetical protein [Microterricola pindariensis]PPL19213.1 hypothetical protein GY24_07065 [Microterricola pindariensis]